MLYAMEYARHGFTDATLVVIMSLRNRENSEEPYFCPQCKRKRNEKEMQSLKCTLITPSSEIVKIKPQLSAQPPAITLLANRWHDYP
jgi:hypothetical protein